MPARTPGKYQAPALRERLKKKMCFLPSGN